MCTLVILRRPDHPWPLILAANRDEMATRPWEAPARHWPDRPEVVAGLDVLGGGTWLGINDAGVTAAILNRPGTLGRAAGRRSRGELVLDALDHADAADAAAALADLNPAAYRPFNLFVADNRDAFAVFHRDPTGEFPVAVEPVPSGLSFITAQGLDSPRSARAGLYRPRFAAAPVPDPVLGTYQAWEALLETRDQAPGGGPETAMFIETPRGFGTVSSAILALPGTDYPAVRPVLRFAAGPPGKRQWETIALGEDEAL